MLTPLDIHNKEFKRAFRGYDEEEVDEFLDLVIADYEKLYKENMELKEKLSRGEDQAQWKELKELENTLKKALVMAQQTADQIKANAEKEAKMIKQEAEAEAARIIAEAQEKARAILNDARRLYEKLAHDFESLRRQMRLHFMEFKAHIEAQQAFMDEFRRELDKIDSDRDEAFQTVAATISESERELEMKWRVQAAAQEEVLPPEKDKEEERRKAAAEEGSAAGEEEATRPSSESERADVEEEANLSYLDALPKQEETFIFRRDVPSGDDRIIR